MIYNYALSAYDDWHRQAWAAGLVLLGLVLAVNIASRMLMSRRASFQGSTRRARALCRATRAKSNQAQ